MNENERQIRKITEQLVKGWEQADRSGLRDVICEDAYIDVTMFGKNISVDEFLRQIGTRPRKTEYARFEMMNYICRIKDDIAKQSVVMLGIYADTNAEGGVDHFSFQGSFANTFRLTQDGWKFSEIRYLLMDENAIMWPRLETDGIKRIKGPGERTFVSNWLSPEHDDRIGVFEDTVLPAFTPEYEAPWYTIPDPDNKGTEEELVEQAFYRYAYGIDFDCFELYNHAFTEDAKIVYGDTRPYDRRGVIEFLKAEKQGSCRCHHSGYFKKVEIDGDKAYGEVYLRAGFRPFDLQIKSIDDIDKKYCWARYKLRFRKTDNDWKIKQLNFYSGFTVQPW